MTKERKSFKLALRRRNFPQMLQRMHRPKEERRRSRAREAADSNRARVSQKLKLFLRFREKIKVTGYWFEFAIANTSTKHGRKLYRNPGETLATGSFCGRIPKLKFNSEKMICMGSGICLLVQGLIKDGIKCICYKYRNEFSESLTATCLSQQRLLYL